MTDTEWKKLKVAVDKSGAVDFYDANGSKTTVEKWESGCLKNTEYGVYYYDGYRKNCVKTSWDLDKLRYLF